MSIPHLRDELGEVLRRLPGQIFAVLDGAHFSDLPSRLRAVKLDYYPLYLDEIDAPKLDAGPHLVVCRNGYAVEQVRDVAAGAPTVVWWFWPDDQPEPELKIYHHLRRLNHFDVQSSLSGERPGPAGDGSIQSVGTAEPVLFRHADPDVVASILPVLSAEQKTHFFGGALAVVGEAPSSDGLLVAQNPSAGAPVPFGRLRLSQDQYAELSNAYSQGMRRRAMIEFIDQIAEGTAQDRRDRINDAVDRAESYGCQTRAQVWDFISLDVRLGPRFEQTAKYSGVLTQLQDSSRPIEERLFRAEQELGFV